MENRRAAWISVASRVTTAQSFEAWLAARREAPRGAPYQEPVNEFAVHIDDGQLPSCAPTRT